ncbi:MAG: class I tRNA ligase family protein, partial [Rickettsiales bacterium]|nr:class I tRNA ligase family protein [Rickettsiales bacterium]
MAENSYPFKEIEQKWQNRWEKERCFNVENTSDKEKYYLLIEFPFPSSSSMHVGHARPYTAMDTYARYMRMRGKNVLFPIGLDSFGAQAEQYAIKTGQRPQITTEESSAVYVRQLKSLGFSFDWDRFISTSHPSYYKWTQWMFIQFFNAGLAYKAENTINWCPACKMALTNEELEQGKCERCGGDVIQKTKSQWTLKMRDYSEKLLDGLN